MTLLEPTQRNYYGAAPWEVKPVECLCGADNRADCSCNLCDECGESNDTRQTIDDYGQSFGVSHFVCRDCYYEHPEPDTGRPDWEDL